MGIGSLGWGGVEANGDSCGDGVSGFAGMTIVGSGSRDVVGAIAGAAGVVFEDARGLVLGVVLAGVVEGARVSGRGDGFSGPAAITCPREGGAGGSAGLRRLNTGTPFARRLCEWRLVTRCRVDSQRVGKKSHQFIFSQFVAFSATFGERIAGDYSIST